MIKEEFVSACGHEVYILEGGDDIQRRVYADYIQISIDPAKALELRNNIGERDWHILQEANHIIMTDAERDDYVLRINKLQSTTCDMATCPHKTCSLWTAMQKVLP